MDCFWFLFAFVLVTIIFIALYNRFLHLFLNPVSLDPLRNLLQFCPLHWSLNVPNHCFLSKITFSSVFVLYTLILNIESKKKVHPESSLIPFHYNIIQDHLNIRQNRFSLFMLHQFIKIMKILDSFLSDPRFSCTLFLRFQLFCIFQRIRKKCFPFFLVSLTHPGL